MTHSTKGDLDSAGRLFEEGIERFNRGEFWLAHESWEQIWLAAEGERRRFLQGLIQIAAVYYHLERGNQRGASRLLAAAIEKLEGLDPSMSGIAIGETRNNARVLLESITQQDALGGEPTFDPPRIRRLV